MGSKVQNRTAIERFSDHSEVLVSTATVYATYTSGLYNGFYQTEAEAQEHCRTYDNGQDYSDSYSVFQSGDLFKVVDNGTVYVSADRSRYIDGAIGDWQIPWVEWVAYSPKPVMSAANS